jgi:hypothetical protein
LPAGLAWPAGNVTRFRISVKVDGTRLFTPMLIVMGAVGYWYQVGPGELEG